MKRFLLRAFKKIGRFFWSWGFLKFLLWSVTLIALLYAEEDWRGARVWEATKARWEAKKVSLDPNAYYPRPVPDDQNLAALPVFAQVPDPDQEGRLAPLKLRQALDEEAHGGELPPLRATSDERCVGVAKAYAHAFPGAKPPARSLDQFEALYPLIPEIRTAAALRPYCRFKQDYTTQPPWSRGAGLIVTQIHLAQKFALDAKIALAENRTQIALEDIETNFRLADGVGRDPILVAGLVSIAITAINRQALDEGLSRHLWNEAQLHLIESKWQKIDFLAQEQFALRGEAVTQIALNYDVIKAWKLPFLRGSIHTGDTTKDAQSEAVVSWLAYWPGGWLDQNKARSVDFLFQEAEVIDPRLRRVFPETSRDLEREAERMMALPSRLYPWNIRAAINTPPLTNAWTKFAQIQAWVDEDRIVCALERYRLAHGVYPTSLDALVPACIDELPNDVMTGDSYRYRLRPDGSFLLYSVGWNQKDDGGTTAYKKEAPEQVDYTQVDYTQGDWAWPFSASRTGKWSGTGNR